MKKRIAVVAVGVIGILLIFLMVRLMGSGATGSSDETPTGNGTGPADPLVSALEERGFEVSEGGFKLWGIEQCPASFDLMGSCYFNNPAAPYDFAVVPHWPDEYVDPATEAAFGETPEGTSTVHRFDPKEAIVVFGTLPAEAAYFGMQSYVFTHEGEYSTDNPTFTFLSDLGAGDIFFHEIPGNPERIGSFNSLSNSNNNVVIERQSGASWNQLRYFIITPDAFMDEAVRQVLGEVSVAEEDIFSESIPSNVRMGLDAAADEFVTFIRYAMPEDGGEEGTASWQWRQEPDLRLLRIRDTRADRSPTPYPAWEGDSPEPRAGVPESFLQADFTDLIARVSQAWGQPCVDGDCLASGQGLQFVDTQSPPVNLVGPKCSVIGMDCLGDTQDATYQFRPGLSFDNGEVYAVVGTLGTETGNAVYVSLGVNNTQLRLGALNVNDSELAGSAEPYGVGNAEKLYVYYFTRDCAGIEDLTHGNCTSVADTEFAVPSGVIASFVERDYIAAGTHRGPDSTLLLPSVALRLSRPAG